MLADLEALDWPAGLDKETSAKLYEACAAEWKADMQSGFVRNVREASEPVEAESLPASRSLQSVSATLTAEEARWRSGGFALQQHWLQEAQSMFVRWRAEDSARLTAALRQAASATVSFEARLVALPPAPRPGWAALCAALRVEAAGPGAVLEAARHEFGAAAAASLAVVEGEQPLLRVLQALHAAGAAEALPGGAGEIYSALRLTSLREGAVGGAGGAGGAGPTARQLCFSSTSEGGIGGDGEGMPSVAAAVCLLLLLASGAAPPPPPPPPPPLGPAALQRQTALQRLDALLPWLLPSMGPAAPYGGGTGSDAGGGASGGGSAGSGGAGDAPALTLAQQRALFSALYSVAAAATAAVRHLAGARRAPPEHAAAAAAAAAAAPTAAECAAAECAAGGAAATTPCVAALRLALQQRPQTWALTPPSARDFVIWCAACDPVIGAALAGACEGEEAVGE